MKSVNRPSKKFPAKTKDQSKKLNKDHAASNTPSSTSKEELKLAKEKNFSSPTALIRPLVGVIMGSKSDWETMIEAAKILEEFKVPYEAKVLSAHRMPLEMAKYAKEAKKQGLKVLIAGAGGAAHLPGMVAAQTILPVLGVPIQSKTLFGVDSLLSIVQMPAGIPVGTFSIGQAGAKNAALFAIALLANENLALEKKLTLFRLEQRAKAASSQLEMPSFIKKEKKRKSSFNKKSS